MRVSLINNFAFISNPQCASSSIRNALDPYAEYKSGKARSADGIILPHHASASKSAEIIKELLGIDRDKLFFFTSIRNPWDRIVSRYKYGLKNENSIWRQRVNESGDFKTFAMNEDYHIPTNYDKYCKIGVDSPLDFVIQVENINVDMKRVCRLIGIPQVSVPHVNRNRAPEPGSYRDYYDAESAAAVGKIFRSDIEEFDYKF